MKVPSLTPTIAKTLAARGRPKKFEEVQRTGAVSEPKQSSVASVNNIPAAKNKKSDGSQSLNQRSSADTLSLRYVFSANCLTSYKNAVWLQKASS
jgi:hypothetical protein